MKNTIRHIAGYAIGVALFLVLIPYWQYNLSMKEYTSFGDNLIDSMTLRLVLSIPIFLLGVVFAIWSNIFLFDVGKGGPTDFIDTAISPRSQKLIISGPYKYCRNPMLFGAGCLYISIGIYLNSIRALMVAVGFLIFMAIYIKLFEEKRLLRDFGNDYIEYRKSVPMIFPLTKMKK